MLYPLSYERRANPAQCTARKGRLASRGVGRRYIGIDASVPMYTFPGMDALDLIVLGRQLARIGERVLRGGSGAEERGTDAGESRSAIAAPTGAGGRALPPGGLLVMRDVLGHPGSSITDIAARTGLPQSYVSESVSRLRTLGMAETRPDPSDGRRTLVQVPASHRDLVAGKSARHVDATLLSALGDPDERHAQQIMAVLSELAASLNVGAPSKVVGQLGPARSRPVSENK